MQNFVPPLINDGKKTVSAGTARKQHFIFHSDDAYRSGLLNPINTLSSVVPEFGVIL